VSEICKKKKVKHVAVLYIT